MIPAAVIAYLNDIEFSLDTLKYFFSFKWLIEVLKDYYFWLLQQCLEIASWLLLKISALLPTFAWANEGLGMLVKPAHVVGYLNWIVPIDVVAFCLTITYANLLAYYGGGWALRWLKVIK